MGRSRAGEGRLLYIADAQGQVEPANQRGGRSPIKINKISRLDTGRACFNSYSKA